MFVDLEGKKISLYSDKIWKCRPQCILMFAFGSSSLDWWGTPCVKNRVSKKQQLGGGTHAKLSPKQFLTFYFFTEKKWSTLTQKKMAKLD